MTGKCTATAFTDKMSPLLRWSKHILCNLQLISSLQIACASIHTAETSMELGNAGFPHEKKEKVEEVPCTLKCVRYTFFTLN